MSLGVLDFEKAIHIILVRHSGSVQTSFVTILKIFERWWQKYHFDAFPTNVIAILSV